ncbi:MAG: c-type cytochrome, partial [Verrucomicrobiota bacterium]|nr:c-type cytochrome [Verrucomicrobiota bacterium]
FKVELLRSAEPGEGSWVSMTTDPKGRLIISPQQGTNNLLRITLSEGKISGLEKIDLPVGSSMGMLYAFDSLYVNGSGPEGLGIYRLRDTNGDDKFDSINLIRKIERAEGEHGSHALLLGPDKKIYVINGNFVKIPADISPNSPHKNYAEDQLLPRANDGNGFGNGVQPPGGSVWRMDADGKNCELFAAGLRNTYDFAFNPEGELFGFDSDMEWDWGTPWYRPIRVNHLVSGGDYGFREGTGKFPEYYADTLPATLNIGIGSPTGVKFGTESKFPEKYKNALFIMDWSYGRIFAIHLTPKGATYTATSELFVKGKPLNVTDLEFGNDGAMYFITGGRGTQSGLYRVTFVGPENKSRELQPIKEDLKRAEEQRELRHQLESFHGKKNPAAIDFAWPHLNSEDRWIRYAARIAIESQDVAQWKGKALSETNTNAALVSLLALARCSGKETQRDLLMALKKFPFDNLSEEQKLEKLRVIELSFIRQGKPESELAKLAIEKLDKQYPAQSEKLNRELCQLLIYLQATNVVPKTLELLDRAKTQEEQLVYILHLRTLKTGWTLEQRKHYFSWFNKNPETKIGEATYPGGAGYYTNRINGVEHPEETLKWFAEAGREYGDGASFPKFISNFRSDAIASLSDDERGELAPFITGKPAAAKTIPPPAPPRNFVKEWKMEDLISDLDKVSRGRNLKKGKEAFAAAQCLQCHRMGNEGGSIGPDITAISSRFSPRDILESILEPSKVLSEQYQNMRFFTKDGEMVSGRILEETKDKIVVVTEPVSQTKTEIKKTNLEKREPSKVSPMPEGLVNILSKEEILDLIAYLEHGGKTSGAFK